MVLLNLVMALRNRLPVVTNRLNVVALALACPEFWEFQPMLFQKPMM